MTLIFTRINPQMRNRWTIFQRDYLSIWPPQYTKSKSSKLYTPAKLNIKKEFVGLFMST